jgi:iron-sulfur cluster assembly protein
MALDESNDKDEAFDVEGFSYIVNKDLLEKATPIKVDFSNYGFRLDCAIDFGAGGCGGCGSSDDSSADGCESEGSCCGS